jgi:NTE family protein
VQINPVLRTATPHSAQEIMNRVNEITFNASLLHDLRAIDFVSRLIDAGRLEGTGYRRMLVHAIADEKALSELGASSKFNVEPEFIDMLFGKGREAAENWLHTSFRHVGQHSTVNVRKLFQGDDDSLDGDQLKPPRRKPKAAE